MRLIARMDDKMQIGTLIDSLKNIGLDRKDMIISDLEQIYRDSREEIVQEDILVQTELESISVEAPDRFVEGISNFKKNEGIIVAVECSRKFSPRVRTVMEEAGAPEIIED